MRSKEEKEETEVLCKLQEIRFAMISLLDTMDNNLSLLDGSIREVRTAHQIAAASNRMARYRMFDENNTRLLVPSK